MPFSINWPTATSGILAGFPAINTSVGQGMLILENAISSNLAYGHASTVFGWSQSSIISSLVMRMLDPTGQPMPNSGLQFVLVGDPNAPNGGVFERFVGLSVPSFGLSFDGATPAIPTPFGLFPHVPLTTIGQELVVGAHQGVNAFISDVHGMSLASSMSQLAAATSWLQPVPLLQHALAAMAAGTFDPAATITKVAYAFSMAADSLYKSLLPLADLVNGLVTAVPAYDASLFFANLSNPLYAIGLPIAADVGLITIGSFLGAAIFLQDVLAAFGYIASLIP